MRFTRFFCLFALLAGLSPAVFGAVIFTDTPSAVSNTYSGFITLQISGLTSGDTVVVQKFLDINTNGIVDSHDPLVQQFNLTDNAPGQVFNNVTNYNVPGDTNLTAGTIGTSLNFQNGDFVQDLIGHYLYVLSSPAGHFTPITNSFNVTNFPFAQNFTGNVVSNSTATTLSNSIILLFPPPRSGHNGPGQPLGGTVANSAGAYTIAMPTGTYTLVAFRTNFATSLGTAPVVTLGSGQTITTNLSLSTNATTSISGTLVDATNNTVKLPGIFLPFSANSLLAIAFSDTNGNFTAQVSSGQWSVGSDDSGLIIHGYVGYNSGTNINSGSTGVVLPFYRANAMFYGSVKDNLGNPIVNVDVNDQDTTSNTYSMDGYTDPNGNFYVGALGFGSSDPWQLSLSGETSSFLTNYDFSQPAFDQNGGTNLAVGTAVLQNFTIILATNTISGTVKDNNNNAITNVQVYGNATIGGVSYNAQATTAANGGYSLNVANGTWNLSVNCGGGNNSLPTNYECPNSITVPIFNNSVVTNFVVVSCSNVQILTTSPLPLGETNVFYNESFQAESCNPSFNWTQNGGTLPPGLSFSGGTLSGVPTASGVYNFTIKVTDGNNNTTNVNFSLSISNGVSIATTSLPNGTNGLNYSSQLQAVNGITPYNWSLASGSLPASLSLSGGGLISGPATTGGTFNFTVQVTDNMGDTANQALSLTLVNTNIPSLTISSAGSKVFVLWPAGAGTNFSMQMTTNLASGPWVPATNGVLQTGFAFTNNGAPAVFYRLQ